MPACSTYAFPPCSLKSSITGTTAASLLDCCLDILPPPSDAFRSIELLFSTTAAELTADIAKLIRTATTRRLATMGSSNTVLLEPLVASSSHQITSHCLSLSSQHKSTLAADQLLPLHHPTRPAAFSRSRPWKASSWGPRAKHPQ